MDDERMLAVYVVRPLPQLVELLSTHGADWRDLLSDPQVYTRIEYDARESWKTWYPRRDAQMKAMYLLTLRDEFFGDGSDDIAVFLNFLIGAPAIDVKRFDQWWYLERFDCIADSFERFTKHLRRDSLRIVAQPHVPGFDDWVKELGENEVK